MTKPPTLAIVTNISIIKADFQAFCHGVTIKIAGNVIARGKNINRGTLGASVGTPISVPAVPPLSLKTYLVKARELVGMVQATSGLESQALPQHQIEAMTEQLIHQLMAGSRRKLWA